MSWGGYCRNKFQTQPTLRKSTATNTFSSHPLRKNKMHPNLHHKTPTSASLIAGGMSIRTTMGNQIHQSQCSSSQVYKEYMLVRTWRKVNPLLCIWGEKKLATISAMNTVRRPETKLSRGTNARTWHSHTWAYIPRNSLIKRNLHPDQDWSTNSNNQDRQPTKSPPRG